MSKNVIEIKNLYKSFGKAEVLKDISLEIKEGEWVSIMGPSGSGKTTLLNILSLMDDLTQGEFYIGGANASSLSEEEKTVIRREKIGLIFQQFHLIPYLTALENVMLAQYYHSVTDEASAKEVLEKVGLSHRLTHLPSELSGGEQQRLCIARALVNEPEVLLADEPTGNLDEENENKVFEIFQELHKEGKTIILITHNPELGSHGDRMVILSHGKVKEEKNENIS